MLSSLFVVCALQAPTIPTKIEFFGTSNALLTQSFFDLEDGSLVERYTFGMKQSVKSRPDGYDWFMERTLVAHRLDETDLDIPKDLKPLMVTSIWNSKGIDVRGRPYFDDWTEYRIDRLRWFAWPGSTLEQGQSWSVEPPIALDHDVPRIRILLTFEKLDRDSSKAWISARSEELGIDAPLRSTGKLLVNIKTGWVERGEWTSPSVPMPGGVSARYRLVQQIVPKSEGRR